MHFQVANVELFSVLRLNMYIYICRWVDIFSIPNDIRITLGAVSCSRREIEMSQKRTAQGNVVEEAGHDENCQAKFSTPWMYISTQSMGLRRGESANRIKMSIARNGGIGKNCLVRKPAPSYMYITLLQQWNRCEEVVFWKRRPVIIRDTSDGETFLLIGFDVVSLAYILKNKKRM